jgi:hypothetical protein
MRWPRQKSSQQMDFICGVYRKFQMLNPKIVLYGSETLETRLKRRETMKWVTTGFLTETLLFSFGCN